MKTLPREIGVNLSVSETTISHGLFPTTTWGWVAYLGLTIHLHLWSLVVFGKMFSNFMLSSMSAYITVCFFALAFNATIFLMFRIMFFHFHLLDRSPPEAKRTAREFIWMPNSGSGKALLAGFLLLTFLRAFDRYGVKVLGNWQTLTMLGRVGLLQEALGDPLSNWAFVALFRWILLKLKILRIPEAPIPDQIISKTKVKSTPTMTRGHNALPEIL